MDLSYIINHLGEERDQYFNAVTPPLMQASNFAYGTVGQMREHLSKEMDSPFYTRGHNPTAAILRKKLAALEAAEECIVFGSGSAAIAAAVLSCVQAGDHVVCVQKPYSWTNKLLNNLLSRYGVESSMVDGTNPDNFRQAIRPNTRLFMLESPNSMTFELQDIPAVVAIAKENEIATIIDNSYSTPLNQQPILMGVDIVVHSGSKYLNGHSDLVAGVLCSTRERCERIFYSEYMTLGAVLSPNEAWLMLRGLRTLPLRMQRVAETTPKVVAFLEAHPGVAQVYYPYSPHFPQYDLAKKQMKRPAGQFSIRLNVENIEAVDRFCDHLNNFLLACSWGGHESLAFPMSATIGKADHPYQSELPWDLIRFYVGLEEADYLIADLDQALAAVSKAVR